jgi:UDP-3-O-acyl N-acetylglucosamine deacetylase
MGTGGSKTEGVRRQRTVARAVECSGTGLHTGATVQARVLPASEDTGVVFVRTDLEGAPRVAATAENRVAYARRTALERGGAEVHTVEHLLSAAAGLGIDNLVIELSAFEAPGLDGSARGWVELLRGAGSVEQAAPVRELAVRERVTVEGENGATLTAEPWPHGLKLTYTLDYPVRSLGRQTVEFEITEDRYAREVAPARTFALEAEALLLRELGLGLGANYENTLVFSEDGVIQNTLRFPDEAARHKLLDLLGDLSLLGRSLRGHVTAVKSGHELNLALVKKLLETQPS